MAKFYVKNTLRLTDEQADTSIFLQSGSVYLGDDHIEVKSHEAVALLSIDRDNFEPADPAAINIAAIFDKNQE